MTHKTRIAVFTAIILASMCIGATMVYASINNILISRAESLMRSAAEDAAYCREIVIPRAKSDYANAEAIKKALQEDFQ